MRCSGSCESKLAIRMTSRRARRRDIALDYRRRLAARASRRPLGQDGVRHQGHRRISASDLMTEPLGRVVATERKPNTPHEFHFWTSLDCPVGIGTIVRVDGAHPVDGQIPHIYGIVVEGFSYTDLQSPMHDVLGSRRIAGERRIRGHRASGDPALHRRGSAADSRRAASAGSDGRGVSRGRRGRRGRAADGRISEGRREHRHSGRRVSRGRHGFGRSISTRIFCSDPRRRTSTSRECPDSRRRRARSSG